MVKNAALSFEIVGQNQRMFVGEKQSDDYELQPLQAFPIRRRKQADQQHNHDQMKTSRDPKRLLNAEIARDGVQSGLAVEVEILTGVENIEAGAPESDRGGKQQDARIERAADGDPCRGGRDSQSETRAPGATSE